LVFLLVVVFFPEKAFSHWELLFCCVAQADLEHAILLPQLPEAGITDCTTMPCGVTIFKSKVMTNIAAIFEIDLKNKKLQPCTGFIYLSKNFVGFLFVCLFVC
jgi:hypothetical protein